MNYTVEELPIEDYLIFRLNCLRNSGAWPLVLAVNKNMELKKILGITIERTEVVAENEAFIAYRRPCSNGGHKHSHDYVAEICF